MSWEESNACTPLKRDFLRAWFAQEQRFFLTGGSALGLFYLYHRRSYDLDLFTSDEVEGIGFAPFFSRVSHNRGANGETEFPPPALTTSPRLA